MDFAEHITDNQIWDNYEKTNFGGDLIDLVAFKSGYGNAVLAGFSFVSDCHGAEIIEEDLENMWATCKQCGEHCDVVKKQF